jgi:hypothetical protein
MPNIFELAFHKDKADKEKIRIDEQQKQYEYYSGDSHQIEKRLVDALEITYDPDDIPEMQLQWVNITEKIINQMAVVYSDPAQRAIMINDKINEDLTEYYLDIIPKNINTCDKEGHRLAKLHNTSLPQVKFNGERFEYRVIPSHFYDVKHEYGIITELSYEKYFDEEWFAVYWTEEEHYRRDAFGNKTPLPDGDGKNPFGVIPYPVFRLKNSIDFWGEGQSDVVNVNEQINVLLTKLVNSDIIMGTEGTTFGVNLDLHKKGEEEDGVKKIRTGRKHPVIVDGVRSDMLQPSLQHISTDPHIIETRDAIDWYIKLIANFNGLNPNAVLSQVKDTSDFQKLMDAVEQMEVRKDDIEPCRIFEEERFEITKTMNNVLKDTPEGREAGLQEIPEDATLKVDFAEVAVQTTPQDKRDDRDWRLANNLITLIDILKEDNPDLTDKEAKKIIQDNKTANSTLGGKAGRFELLTKKEGLND